MTTGATATDGVWAPARRRLTVGLVLTVTLVAFEALSVATILPVVSRQLGDLRLYGWVFSAFLLASLMGIALTGSLSDRYPLAAPMVGGLTLFAIGLIVGGTAVDMPVLVAGRAIQGLGAGAVPATAYAAISRGYPSSDTPRMFAVLSTAWVVPGLIGPVAAAVVAGAVGWRWVFLGLVPMVVVAGLLAVPVLGTVTRPPSVAGRRRGGASGLGAAGAGPTGVGACDAPVVGESNEPDAVGSLGAGSTGGTPGAAAAATGTTARRLLPALGVVGGAGLVLSGLTSGRVAGVVGLIVGGALLVVSLRPLTPAGTLVARSGLPATVLSRGMLTFCFFAGDAYVPFALTMVRHTSTAFAGLVLTAGTMTWTAGAWVQERRITRWGPRRLVAMGEGLVVGGLVVMAVALLPAVSVWWAIVAWSVAGLGMGLAYAPLSVTALDRAPTGREGRTTAGLQLSDVLGQALGTGVAGAAVAAGVHGLGSRRGVALAFAIGIVVGLAALVVVTRVPNGLLGDRIDTADGPSAP